MTAPVVGMGAITIRTRNARGQAVEERVPLETEVSPRGVPVERYNSEGRKVTVSTKVADMYPEQFTEKAPAPAKG